MVGFVPRAASVFEKEPRAAALLLDLYASREPQVLLAPF